MWFQVAIPVVSLCISVIAQVVTKNWTRREAFVRNIFLFFPFYNLHFLFVNSYTSNWYQIAKLKISQEKSVKW